LSVEGAQRARIFIGSAEQNNGRSSGRIGSRVFSRSTAIDGFFVGRDRYCNVLRNQCSFVKCKFLWHNYAKVIFMFLRETRSAIGVLSVGYNSEDVNSRHYIARSYFYI